MGKHNDKGLLHHYVLTAYCGGGLPEMLITMPDKEFDSAFSIEWEGDTLISFFQINYSGNDMICPRCNGTGRVYHFNIKEEWSCGLCVIRGSARGVLKYGSDVYKTIEIFYKCLRVLYLENKDRIYCIRS